MRTGISSRLRAAAIVAAAVVSSLSVSVPTVGAQACDDVVDETATIDTAEVRDAVAALAGVADAKVYIFPSVPGGDIETAVEELIARCFSDGPQGRQFDLVLISVSLGDRMTTIQYGGEHNVELGPTEASIQRDIINPRLADGDITGAIVAGLEAIGDELSVGAVAPEGVGSGDDTGGGALTVGLVIVGLAAAGGSVRLIRRRRRLTDARNGLEAASQQPLVDVGAARERMSQLDASADVVDRTVAGRTQHRIDELRSLAAKRMETVDGAAANFRRSVQGGIESLSMDGVSNASSRLGELRAGLEAAQEATDRVQQFGDRIERLRVTMPVKSARLREDVADSLALADQRTNEGWEVAEIRQQLSAADRRLAELDLAELAIDALSADATIEEAEAVLFAARHDLQTLPDRRAGLVEWAGELRTSMDRERARLASTESQLSAFEPDHAPESVARAGSPADVWQCLERSDRDRILGEHQIEDQAWEAAAGNLESAGLWLVRADDLLDQMDTLIVSLESARREAPELLEEIARAISELDQFIARNDADLPERFDIEPGRAATAHDALVAELQRSRPNYLRVAETGSALARRIDAVFLAARRERDRTVALRREVERERKRARREIERADKTIGWQVFESDQKRSLESLERMLEDASGDLESQLAVAAEIRTRAAQIRADVVADRRRRTGWVVGGGGGFGGGGFGGGGGGFGGGGGGGFGGGGSSSSW